MAAKFGHIVTQETRDKIGQKNSVSLLGNIPWNKGKRTRLIPKTAFKKGFTPWNKGKKNWMIPWNKGKKYIQISGKRNPRWKGGITSLYHAIRTSFEYKLWRADVFERDKYTCQDCGERGGILNADHIKPFAIIIKENNIKNFDEALKCEELWDIDNGHTLCVPCHKKTETYGYKTIKLLI